MKRISHGASCDPVFKTALQVPYWSSRRVDCDVSMLVCC